MIENFRVDMGQTRGIFLLFTMLISTFLTYVAHAKNFSLTPSVGASSNRYTFDSLNNKSSLDVELLASYKSPSEITYGNYLAASREFQGEQKWELIDGYLYGSKSLGQLGDEIAVAGLVRLYYPSSETSRDYDRLLARVMLAPVFTSDLSLIKAPFIGLTYRPSYTHSFHRYSVSLNGKSNVRSSIGNLFSVAVNAWDLVSFTSSLSYSISWTHQNNQRPDSFLWAQVIAIPVTDKAELSLSYENTAGAKDSTGLENNVKPFDDQTGVFAAAVSFNL